MSARNIRLPIKEAGSERWAQLSFLADKHVFVAEKWWESEAKYSSFGGHRVRVIHLQKNVQWLLPSEAEIYDIQSVNSIEAPRRETKSKHGKGK